MASRSIATLLAAALGAGLAGQGQAQTDAAPSDAERQAIRDRIQSLQAEIGELRTRLARPAEEPPQTAPAASAETADTTPPTEAPIGASVAERRLLEEESSDNPFSITAHHRNYLLPLSYTTSPNRESFNEIDREADPDRLEVKFQFSAKFKIADDVLFDRADLYFGYTQRSWWQAYNADASSPFRETNYEPEVFADFENDWSLLGWTNINNRVSLNHQSNGRSGSLSRSWNRLILTSTFINDDWAVSLSPYWRLPETEGEDDNPDIEDYLGYADVTVARRLFDDHEASLLWRGNPDQGHMGAQLDYSWPLFGKIRGHVQFYQGYGESLIDYDRSTQRVSLGFSLNPLFSTGTFSR
ncbi:phospholipase [Halomonas sp. ND22Bw]|uniref:Phospholipase A1 n=1 Tax=Halomonas salina TaxID=42565 RepID=A0ABR4WVG2_9GAMM|nr:phospholipase A [Halomonas salina]KGE78400.1 phospholipase [Halomonas salina]PSJ20993.1 phospholipase [Halomonas sp. ND22Bw]